MSKVFGLFFWATSRLNHKIQKTPWISGVETQFAEFGIWKINPKTWMMWGPENLKTIRHLQINWYLKAVDTL